MHVVILGCGRVGATLAKMLEVEGHTVAIIDRDREAFRRLGRGFKGKTILGIGIDEDVLRKAGIERAGDSRRRPTATIRTSCPRRSSR